MYLHEDDVFVGPVCVLKHPKAGVCYVLIVVRTIIDVYTRVRAIFTTILDPSCRVV